MLGATISLLAAIVPTVLYVGLFYWADRFEREPIWLLSVAFVWGAVPAVVVSLAAELLIEIPLGPATDLASALVAGALIAPVVEELAKGLALLAIFLLMRSEFDGVLDGLIYGALVGFGFAMTENFLYFLGAYQNGSYGALYLVIFLRVVLFGLNHAFYTGLTGIGFGLARISSGRFASVVWPVFGLSGAMLTHCLHNLGAITASVSAWAMAISLAVAMAGVAIVFVAMHLSWRQERAIIRRELAEEVGICVTPLEYGSLLGRWQRPLRPRGRARQVDRRRQLSVELALYKNRARRRGVATEPGLAEQIRETRRILAEQMPRPDQRWSGLGG